MPKSTPPTIDVPAKGTRIGDKYLIGEIIARGGMGCVVRAEHQLLGHDVAIKFLRASSSRSARSRLLREGRAMRALSSEYVARVFDLGVHDEAPYIVMELLEGEDLRRRVQRDGPMSVADAVDAVLEACAAVAEAHALGIVHRDLKPANLFFATTRSKKLVKVLDFGISKVDEPHESEDLHATGEDSVLGTPHFMSPEQLRNPAKIDVRTDIWSLGVTLFFLLTAELPFEGETRSEITGAIFADAPTPLDALRPDAPAELSEAIQVTLIKRPEERVESIEAWVARLLPFATRRGRAAAEQLAHLKSTADERESEPPTLPASQRDHGGRPRIDRRRDRPSPAFRRATSFRYAGAVAVTRAGRDRALVDSRPRSDGFSTGDLNGRCPKAQRPRARRPQRSGRRTHRRRRCRRSLRLQALSPRKSRRRHRHRGSAARSLHPWPLPARARPSALSRAHQDGRSTSTACRSSIDPRRTSWGRCSALMAPSPETVRAARNTC